MGMEGAGINEMLVSLVVDGIVSGVGGILTFLPNIIILFWPWPFWRTAAICPGRPMSWTAL